MPGSYCSELNLIVLKGADVGHGGGFLYKVYLRASGLKIVA